MSSEPLSPTAKKNVATIAHVEQKLFGKRSRIDRIGNGIAHFFGTFRFIMAHVVVFVGWFVVNGGLVPNVQPIDPYPFPFLGLIVSIEFIFLTTFVLMNQALQARRAEHWAHLNLQLAMLAEHEVTKNMQMLHRICRHLGLEQPTGDGEVKELKQATQVATLVDEIANKLGEMTEGD
jgi:uncharacterized membrane protein